MGRMPHLTNLSPMGRGFFRWGGKFPPFNTENTGKTGFMPANFVNCYLSSLITIIANFSKLQFESLLKDVSKYILRLLYHHYIVKVFILEKKSGLSISLNLVSLSLHCFHPEPKTLDCHLCLFFSTTEPL